MSWRAYSLGHLSQADVIRSLTVSQRVTGFNLLGGKETVQIGFNATGNTASTWVNVSRDASSADALLRFKYIIKSTDLTGKSRTPVFNVVHSLPPGAFSTLGSLVFRSDRCARCRPHRRRFQPRP